MDAARAVRGAAGLAHQHRPFARHEGQRELLLRIGHARPRQLDRAGLAARHHQASGPGDAERLQQLDQQRPAALLARGIDEADLGQAAQLVQAHRPPRLALEQHAEALRGRGKRRGRRRRGRRAGEPGGDEEQDGHGGGAHANLPGNQNRRARPSRKIRGVRIDNPGP